MWLTYFWVFILFIYLFTKLKKKDFNIFTDRLTQTVDFWLGGPIFFLDLFFIGTHFSNLNPDI